MRRLYDAFHIVPAFFRHLFQGDPVALTVAGALLGITLLALFIWWRIARNLRQEDERRRPKKAWKVTKK